ncbi:MAG: OmpA family protein [Peptococcaceae bacterium]|nr:OmpA family protein [Peptococcaceae bacterium]
MPRKHKDEGRGPSHERWLVTYADLITLLMIFFIMMYSMSQIDANKFRALAESLAVTLGGGNPTQIEISTSPTGPSVIGQGTPLENTANPGKDLFQRDDQSDDLDSSGGPDVETLTIEHIKAKLDALAKENNIQTMLVSTIEERGLVVSIQDTLLFDSGSAEITPKARSILQKISGVLSASPNFIKVEGHTDNLPINTVRFPSNWELSVLRATNVVHILVEEGGINPERLSATGYGEYRPRADNNTEEGRSANRRVDLVILRSKYDPVEPGF